MTITAINKTYQSAITKAYKHYRAYHALVNLDGTFDTDKEQNANERKQAAQDEKFSNIYGELPKREQVNFDRQHKIIHGY